MLCQRIKSYLNSKMWPMCPVIPVTDFIIHTSKGRWLQQITIKQKLLPLKINWWCVNLGTNNHTWHLSSMPGHSVQKKGVGRNGWSYDKTTDLNSMKINLQCSLPVFKTYSRKFHCLHTILCSPRMCWFGDSLLLSRNGYSRTGTVLKFLGLKAV